MSQHARQEKNMEIDEFMAKVLKKRQTGDRLHGIYNRRFQNPVDQSDYEMNLNLFRQTVQEIVHTMSLQWAL